MTPSASASVTRSQWGVIWLLIGAGMAMALHIGKVPPALPALRQELGLSLEAAGWLVSLVNLTGAFIAILLALVADRLGHLRLIAAGAALTSVASLMAAAGGSATLFVCRFLEGLGFLVATLSVPPLLLCNVAATQLRLVFGLWSAYLPAGAGVIMIGAAMLPAGAGWQWLWCAAACTTLAIALAVSRLASGRPDRSRTHAVQRVRVATFGEVLRTPGVLLLGACFGLYSGSWYAVVGVLPILQVERLGFSTSMAALVTALVVFSNVAGNVAAGWLLHHGAQRLHLLTGGSIVMGCSAAGLFLDLLPDGTRILMAFVYSSIGGVIPGSIFASLPRFSPRPATIGVATGVVVQMTNIGSLLGPPMTGLLVGIGGWPASLWWIGTAFTLIVLLAWMLQRLERKQHPPT